MIPHAAVVYMTFQLKDCRAFSLHRLQGFPARIDWIAGIAASTGCSHATSKQ
jgi:hypothetical protein